MFLVYTFKDGAKIIECGAVVLQFLHQPAYVFIKMHGTIIYVTR